MSPRFTFTPGRKTRFGVVTTAFHHEDRSVIVFKNEKFEGEEWSVQSWYGDETEGTTGYYAMSESSAFRQTMRDIVGFLTDNHQS